MGHVNLLDYGNHFIIYMHIKTLYSIPYVYTQWKVEMEYQFAICDNVDEPNAHYVKSKCQGQKAKTMIYLICRI